MVQRCRNASGNNYEYTPVSKHRCPPSDEDDFMASCLSQLLNHSTPCTRRYITTYSQIYTQLNGTWPCMFSLLAILHQ